MLWRLKWAIELIEELPDVPLTSLVAAIDDVEEVYRAEGAALRPVHSARARLARQTGDADAVARELSAWLAEPRDSHSDCLACEHRGQSRVIAPDDPSRALELLAPVVDGDLTCDEEPRTSLADAAELRLALGDVEGAVDAYRRSWHLCQDDPSAATTVASCLRVLLRLGNTDRAVDLLLPRLGWLDELPSPLVRMWFSATAAHVLDRALVVGLAPAEVDGRPVSDVARELRGSAFEIAAAFDARHGSTVVSADPGRRSRRRPRPHRADPSAHPAAGDRGARRAVDAGRRARHPSTSSSGRQPWTRPCGRSTPPPRTT